MTSEPEPSLRIEEPTSADEAEAFVFGFVATFSGYDPFDIAAMGRDGALQKLLDDGHLVEWSPGRRTIAETILAELDSTQLSLLVQLTEFIDRQAGPQRR
jgi:hypothetical protein